MVTHYPFWYKLHSLVFDRLGFMRVLYFYKTYYPDSLGGIEQFINQLARATHKLGIQSDVLALSDNPSSQTLTIDGHTVHQVKKNIQIASTGFSLSAFAKFASLAKTADLIHYNFPWPFMDIVHFATQVKKPTVVTYHSDIVKQQTLLKFYKPLQKQFLTRANRIIATSPNYLETSPVLKAYRHKTSVIPIGLDKSIYPTPSAEKLNRWQNALPARFFLFIGVFRYYKGLHILLDALKKTDYPTVIIGSGPMEEELKKQASHLKLQNIYFLGTLADEDKVALLQLCFALVFPSHLRSEAFGISLLEGAMYGKPMISCEIGTGTSFININGETGLVIESNNTAALEHAMQTLWNEETLAKKMGELAEKRYWELFTADHMAKQYSVLYKQVIDSANSYL